MHSTQRRRLTRSVFADLGIRMVALGLATGVAFPFFVLVLGVDPAQALSVRFFSATIAAGLMVGGLNFLLCRVVVGERVRLLSVRLRMVGETIRTATALGDWSGFDAERCRLPIDSDDDLGESARACNQLVDAVERLRVVEAELNVSRVEARTDELTGLGNRRHFYLACDRHLAAATESDAVALLLVDLDHFKEINDALGHHVGDELLRLVAERLRVALPDTAVLARLGGDEFVALLGPGTTAVKAIGAGNAFLEILDEPFPLNGLLAHVRASVGVVICPEHGGDRSELLRHADVAMYRAKAGGGGVELYAADRDEHTAERVILAGELRAALDSDELILHYQPIVELSTGVVTSVEALVRWRHPSRGLLSPDQFLPLVEQHGLSRQLTQRVLRVAAAQATEWERDGRAVRIAVNLAPANLLDVRFPDDVAEVLRSTGAVPELLQLEITEGTLMLDPERVLDVLARLSELGIALALDDFGTGYSSMSNITRLPVQELKIDRSFVTDMERSHDDAVIVRSVIDLARNLGMRVVAEGVEAQETTDRLLGFGCHSAQGYHFSRPLPADELDAWLEHSALSPRRRLA
jgi:diguanylate cyclase (GGDEF)-like protein